MNQAAPFAPEPPNSPRKRIVAVSVASVCGVILLAGVALPDLGRVAAQRRDQRRLEDLRVARDAIETYWRERGRLPACEPDQGEYDTSLDLRFLGPLIEAGFLHRTLIDPRNDEALHYCYRRLDRGVSERPAYLLGVRGFETRRAPPSLRPDGPADPELDDLAYFVVGPQPAQVTADDPASR